MCLYWYHSSVPEARSAGRIRRWPTTNFPPSCSLLPPFPPSLSLSVSAVTAFSVVLRFALCLPPLLCFSPLSIRGHGSATRHDTFDRSEWHSPSPLDASGQRCAPPTPYMHNNPTVPLSLPWNASLPHPLSLVFSFYISSGHFVTEQKSGRGNH